MVCGILRSVAGVLLAVSAATAHAEILIGAADPLTGEYSWYGEQTDRAVGMAAARREVRRIIDALTSKAEQNTAP